MKNNRFLYILIILLIALNIATLVYIYLQSKPNIPAGDEPKNLVIKELNLNSSQIEAYEKLVTVHRSQMRNLQSDLQNSKIAIFENLSEINYTDSQFLQKEEIVTAIYAQMDLITFRHFQQLRLICDTEQQQRLDLLITEVIQMMNRPHPPRKK